MGLSIARDPVIYGMIMLELAFLYDRRIRRQHARLTNATSRALVLERVAFGLRRPKGNGSDDNFLRKIRNQVKLAP
jgi:hypothetical protein